MGEGCDARRWDPRGSAGLLRPRSAPGLLAGCSVMRDLVPSAARDPQPCSSGLHLYRGFPPFLTLCKKPWLFAGSLEMGCRGEMIQFWLPAAV